jgi:hypothetical protein
VVVEEGEASIELQGFEKLRVLGARPTWAVQLAYLCGDLRPATWGAVNVRTLSYAAERLLFMPRCM